MHAQKKLVYMLTLAGAYRKKSICELLHLINIIYVFLNWCALYAEKFLILFIRNYFLQQMYTLHESLTRHHCPLLTSFYIIRNQSKHAYLHSLNSKNGNPGCLVKSISYQLTKNFKNWRSPFSIRKPRRSKIPSIFSAPEGSLFIAFSTK